MPKSKNAAKKGRKSIVEADLPRDTTIGSVSESNVKPTTKDATAVTETATSGEEAEDQAQSSCGPLADENEGGQDAARPDAEAGSQPTEADGPDDGPVSETERPKAIENLFQDHEEADDPFAQVMQVETVVKDDDDTELADKDTELAEDDAASQTPVSTDRTEQPSTRIAQIFEDEESADDPFGGIMEEPKQEADGEEVEEAQPHAVESVPTVESILVEDDTADDPFGAISQKAETEAEPVSRPEETVQLGSTVELLDDNTADDPFDAISQEEEMTNEAVSQPTELVQSTSVIGLLDDDTANDSFSTLSQEEESTAPVETSTEPAVAVPTIESILADDDDDSNDPFGAIHPEGDFQPDEQEQKPDESQFDNHASHASTPAPEPAPTRIEEIFGGDEESDDPFGQIQPEDEIEEEPLQGTVAEKPIEEVPTRIEQIFGEEDGSNDAFADLTIEKEETTLSDTEPTAGSSRVDATPTAAQLAAEKDFSDLLAEFEDDFDIDPQFGAETTAAGSQHYDTPAALFADDHSGSMFDEFDQQQQRDSAEATASNLQAQNVGTSAGTSASTQDANETIAFDVPQGWYDDDGTWNWYTEDQKELVRQTMMGQGDWDQPEKPVLQAQNLATPIYSPAIGGGQSENAARRTPQPEQSSRLAQPENSYNPYAPPTMSQPSTSSPYAPASSSSWANTASSYGSAAVPSFAPAPVASPYDPYAPSTSAAKPPIAPYGTPSRAYTTSSAPSSVLGNRAPVSDAARPKPPARVVSNAYDPPFLRTQKSFVRPASAMSLTPAPFSAPQKTLSPPPPPQPAAPPSGPPRRAKTPSAAAPSYAAPPARRDLEPPMPERSLPETHRSPPMQTQEDPYRPSQPPMPQIPHLASPGQAAPSLPSAKTPAQSRPPPRNQSYNSFDPPLRPSSAARARPVAAMVPERTVTPPIAVVAPPPAQTAPAGPPRGPSRGSLRKPSPMFESRPPMPAFERPPSRTNVVPPRGASPLVAAAEIPSRPASRAQVISEPPAPQQSAEDDYDPEGGVGDNDGPVWSPQRRDTAVIAPRDDGNWIQEAEETRADSQDYMQATRAESLDPSPHDYSAVAEEYVEDRSPAQAPPQQSAYAPSAYDPSPYQPSAPSAVSISNTPSWEPRQESNGLGLGGIDDVQAQSQPVYNPYAPSTSSVPIDQSQYAPQPAANTSQPPAHTRQSSTYDPYAPGSSAGLLNPNDTYSRQPPASSYNGSDLGMSPPQPSYFQAMANPSDNTYVPQQVLEQRPVAEDPLGRSTLAARNAPLAVFGFGGVLITGFPAQAETDSSMSHHRTPSYGYASGRGQLWIRTVSDLASTSALKPNDNVFPGPLVGDPSTPRGAAGEKKRRDAVIVYLQARAEEIERGLPYLKSSASQAKREEEGKLVLVRILLAMVLGDGKLSGKPEADDALRLALSNMPDGSVGTGMSFAAPAAASSTSSASSSKADPSRLAELSNMLSRGDKREAAEHAAQRGLWSHALLIASSVDQDMWTDMVARFAQAELGSQADMAALKASYAVFSGKTASSVDDLISAANLTGDQSKDQWREVIAAVVFNGKQADLACLDELGARYRKAGLNYPAHVCHLLSPSSPFADVTAAAFDRSIALTQNVRDEDAVVFAEIAEYARSLVTLPKGQELPFAGLPQLLPYKLQQAWLAAELGDVDRAKRYCTAVETSSKPSKNAPSPLAPALAASLEDLTERLTGTPSTNPAKLIGGRKTKSGAGIGSWIEGRLTKFIAGEEDASMPAKPVPAAPSKDSDAPVGPFSHFSTISPAASGGVSRNTSAADLGGPNGGGSEAKLSPKVAYSSWGQPDQTQATDPSSSYVGDYGAGTGASGASGWTSWSAGQEAPQEEESQPVEGEDEGEFINPMAALSLGGSHGAAPNDYQPSGNSAPVEEDDDEDMGFGNTSLSRGKTPRPAAPAGAGKAVETKADTKKTPVEDKKGDLEKPAPKSGWLGGWFGKKEGQASGPVRAKLGDESSMIYDKDLKRWVVKGAKPEAAAPSPPPPPPRTQSASPAQAPRANVPAGSRTAAPTPPPSQVRNGPPGSSPRPGGPPMGQSFAETPDGGIRRMKSSLAESITADQASGPPSAAGTPPPPGGGPPGGPPVGGSRPPMKAAGGSLDDLLSRPPSKRPGSAAKKPMRNRYVDVLTPGTEGGA